MDQPSPAVPARQSEVSLYSVVHDPPGSNGASIAKGTAVNTVVELNKAYSSSVREGWSITAVGVRYGCRNER